jgi:chromate transporter
MTETPAESPPIPSLAALFLIFAVTSVSGFGGVLPWARRMIVEERKWLTAEQFNEVFSLSQFLPGPNVVNFSVVIGARFHGARGSLAAVLGLLAPPVAIMIALGILYGRYGEIPAVQRGLAGLAAAAAGLLIATAVKMAEPIFRQPLTPGPYVALIAFAAVGLLRWPLHWVLLALAPLSLALAWWLRR